MANGDSSSEYVTLLPPEEEAQFQQWVKDNKIPWRDDPQSDYDMRGFWKGAMSGDPVAKRNLQSKHFPDKWKTPYHKTFSDESIYSKPEHPGGHWNGDKFSPPDLATPDLSQLGSYTNVPSKGGPAATSLTASTNDAQSILNAAVAASGALSTKGDPGTQGGELACADAVCKILQNAGVQIKPTLSTSELQSELVNAGFNEVDPSTPGAVIISPTQGGRHGHTGVVGMDGRIYSNSSAKGMFEQNYTLDSWNRSFGGLGVHAYLPAGSEAAASHPSISDTGPDYTSQPTPTRPKPAQPAPQKPAPASQPEIPRSQLPQNTLASSSFTPVQSSAAGTQKPIKKMTAMPAPQIESPIDLPAYPDEYIDRVYQWLQENPDIEL